MVRPGLSCVCPCATHGLAQRRFRCRVCCAVWSATTTCGDQLSHQPITHAISLSEPSTEYHAQVLRTHVCSGNTPWGPPTGATGACDGEAAMRQSRQRWQQGVCRPSAEGDRPARTRGETLRGLRRQTAQFGRVESETAGPEISLTLITVDR